MNTPLGNLLWFWGTSLLLAGLLYVPVNKLIWVIGIRRLERRLGRAGDPAEQARARRRARMIAGVLALTFAFFFNRTLISPG